MVWEKIRPRTPTKTPPAQLVLVRHLRDQSTKKAGRTVGTERACSAFDLARGVQRAIRGRDALGPTRPIRRIRFPEWAEAGSVLAVRFGQARAIIVALPQAFVRNYLVWVVLEAVSLR